MASLWTASGLLTLMSRQSDIPSRTSAEIRKEGAFLLDLLEDLTQEFELELNILEGNLQSLSKDAWEIKTEIVLKNLEKEDVERYGTGRREMGVVMEIVSEEAMDDESEVGTDDKGEDDGVQGSGHDGEISGEDEDGL